MAIPLAGCVLLREKKILLIHRIAKDWWELPGGKIEPGETGEQTVVREAREELGCKIWIIRELGSKEFKEGERTFMYHWFLAQTGMTPRIGEPQVHDKLAFFSVDELENMSISPNVRNLLAAWKTLRI